MHVSEALTIPHPHILKFEHVNIILYANKKLCNIHTNSFIY